MKGNYPGFGKVSGLSGVSNSDSNRDLDGSGEASNPIEVSDIDKTIDIIEGKDYNTAGSGNVGKVESIHITSNQHSKERVSTPNSVIKNYMNGKLNNERYYGKDGKAYLDIDYTNHGNPKTHPHVPHEHKISFKNGKMIREKSDGRIKKWKKKN